MLSNTKAKHILLFKTHKAMVSQKPTKFPGGSGSLHVVSCIGRDQTPPGNFVGFLKHMFSLWFLKALVVFPGIFATLTRDTALTHGLSLGLQMCFWLFTVTGRLNSSGYAGMHGTHVLK